MAATKYTYAKQVNAGKLEDEIRTSSVLTALDFISTTNGSVDIWFKDELSTDDETLLGTIITNHDPTVTENDIPLILIQEEDPIKSTGGHFQSSTFNLDIPAGEIGRRVSKDFVYPIPVAILAAQVLTTDSQRGDIFDFIVSPETTVGALAQNAPIGTTKFYVTSTVIDNAFLGMFLTINDGTNTERLGRITEIGPDYIVSENASTIEFLATTPSYVQICLLMVWNFEIFGAGRIVIGESKIGASYVPAG